MRYGPQNPTFVIEEPNRDSIVIGTTADDASQLVDELEREPTASMATKVRAAMQLDNPAGVPTGDIKPGIGEDEAIVRAVANLRQRGESSTALDNLADALQARIDRSS